MQRRFLVASSLVVASAISCSHSSKPAPTPAPAPATVTVTAPPAGGRGAGAGSGAAAGAPGGGGRGTPQTPEQVQARRDSLAGLRAATVQQLMATIAGKEDQPAGQVFKNVQVWKDMPAKRFLIAMDSTVGRALSNNCSSCHDQTDYSADGRGGKARTRIMMTMVDAINKEHLSKLPAGRGGSTPTVACITCHRGIGGNPGARIMPPG